MAKISSPRYKGTRQELPYEFEIGDCVRAPIWTETEADRSFPVTVDASYTNQMKLLTAHCALRGEIAIAHELAQEVIRATEDVYPSHVDTSGNWPRKPVAPAYPLDEEMLALVHECIRRGDIQRLICIIQGHGVDEYKKEVTPLSNPFNLVKGVILSFMDEQRVRLQKLTDPSPKRGVVICQRRKMQLIPDIHFAEFDAQHSKAIRIINSVRKKLCSNE